MRNLFILAAAAAGAWALSYATLVFGANLVDPALDPLQAVGGLLLAPAALLGALVGALFGGIVFPPVHG